MEAELAEVEVELAAGPSSSAAREPVKGKRKSVLPPRPPVDLLAELGGLRERLGALDLEGANEDGIGPEHWRERLERLGAGGAVQDASQPADEEDGVDESGVMAPGTGKAGLSELDKRLAQLEDLIGPSSFAPDDVILIHNIRCSTLIFLGNLTPAAHHREARPPFKPPDPTTTPRRHLPTRQTPARRPRSGDRSISLQTKHRPAGERIERHPLLL